MAEDELTSSELGTPGSMTETERGSIGISFGVAADTLLTSQ